MAATVSVLAEHGPDPVGAAGTVYVPTTLEIVAHAPIVGLAVTQFELTDDRGAVVARGTDRSLQPLERVSNQRSHQWGCVARQSESAWMAFAMCAARSELKPPASTTRARKG